MLFSSYQLHILLKNSIFHDGKGVVNYNIISVFQNSVIENTTHCQKQNMSSSVSVKSYADVQKLSASNLKAYCNNLGIDISLPKSVRVNAVCHCLGISTTGTCTIQNLTPRVDGLSSVQQKEFDLLTPAVLYSLSGWTNDLTKVPLVDDADVKRYLLQTNVIEASAARTYKVTRPYQLRDFVHSMRYHELPSSATFCAVKGLCNPSQSANKDDVKMVMVILDKHSGQPYGGYCTCTVGYVLLFLMHVTGCALYLVIYFLFRQL